MRRGCFALIELLLVISIIALLIALLLSALQLARDPSVDQTCVNSASPSRVMPTTTTVPYHRTAI